jgi:uncharacterized protein involved in high-affinity Fe2+ transport
MKIRNAIVLLLIVAFALAGCTGSGGQASTTAPAETAAPVAAVAPEEEAGFDEFPLGDDIELGPLNVAGVYFQPVDMVPASAGLPASEADIHIEADISALDNELGYGVGDFVPNLTVDYDIAKSTGYHIEGTFMPMNASDGPHYGANVKLDGPGDYKIRFTIISPETQNYVLHVDQTTGVTGRFWNEPLVAEWDFVYAGPAW